MTQEKAGELQTHREKERERDAALLDMVVLTNTVLQDQYHLRFSVHSYRVVVLLDVFFCLVEYLKM